MSSFRVGVIGSGMIAQRLLDHISRTPGLELAFIHARDPAKLSSAPPDAVLADLASFTDHQADVVVEAAHPVYLDQWGERLLAHADLMPLSVSALGDDDLRNRLTSAAATHGTSLLVSRGALIGVDGLTASSWDDVSIEFVKHPDHIDFEDFGDPGDLSARRVLYEGTVRGISRLFPRNINAMVALALATVGLDRCTCTMISDPAAAFASLEIRARADDGHELHLVKREPMLGVSGEYLFNAIAQGIERPRNGTTALQFV